MKFFYNNWGIHALNIYSCFVLIDLINYKLLLCDGFYENCLFNGFSYKSLVYGGFYGCC